MIVAMIGDEEQEPWSVESEDVFESRIEQLDYWRGCDTDGNCRIQKASGSQRVQWGPGQGLIASLSLSERHSCFFLPVFLLYSFLSIFFYDAFSLYYMLPFLSLLMYTPLRGQIESTLFSDIFSSGYGV